jgi:predicted component of type VI protein secretion system
MDRSRRLTPVVPAPPPSNAPDRKANPVLKAPIAVVTPAGQWELENGELVFGRADDSGIVIDDPLVSRTHARLRIVSGDEVMLEDLNSTNGVFINGVRLNRSTAALNEGDRLLLGTTEISVFTTRSSAKLSLQQRIGTIHLASRAGQIAEPPPASGPRAARPAPASDELPPTERSDTMELVGKLADRLVAQGKVQDATRILSAHLDNILLGASSGLSVTNVVLDHATRYALRLHIWTGSTTWIDYVFELHVACKHAPTAVSLDALETVYPLASGADRRLVEHLVQTLEARPGGVRPGEEARVARLLDLTKAR